MQFSQRLGSNLLLCPWQQHHASRPGRFRPALTFLGKVRAWRRGGSRDQPGHLIGRGWEGCTCLGLVILIRRQPQEGLQTLQQLFWVVLSLLVLRKDDKVGVLVKTPLYRNGNSTSVLTHISGSDNLLINSRVSWRKRGVWMALKISLEKLVQMFQN